MLYTDFTKVWYSVFHLGFDAFTFTDINLKNTIKQWNDYIIISMTMPSRVIATLLKAPFCDYDTIIINRNR